MCNVVDNRVKTTAKGVIKILFEELKKHVRKANIDSIPILTQKLCALMVSSYPYAKIMNIPITQIRLRYYSPLFLDT